MNLRYAGLVLIVLLASCGHNLSAIPHGNDPFNPSPQTGMLPDRLTAKKFVAFYKIGQDIPGGITTGPDGNLWYDTLHGYLGRLTPTGVITTFLGASLGPIAPGSGGTLWFSSSVQAYHICKSSTAGVIQCFATPSYIFAEIAKGQDGNEWYTAYDGASIGKETPTGINVEYPLPDTANGATPMGLAAGPDGNLWFTEQNNTTVMVGKITTGGVITEYPLGASCVSTLGFVPIVMAKDANLWVAATCSGEHIVASVNTSGVVTAYPVPAEVSSLIVGPDGQLWSAVVSQMYEFDLKTHVQSSPVTLTHKCEVEFAPYLNSSVLTLGPDGDVWISGFTCGGILVYEETLKTIGIRLNGEMSFTDPNYGFELGYAVGTTSTQTQTISLGMGESVQFKNVDTEPHSAAFLGNATSISAPWPGSFNGSTTQSPAGTAIGTSGWATGSLNPNKTSPIYETGLPGFYMIGCQYHYNTNEMRTVLVVH